MPKTHTLFLLIAALALAVVACSGGQAEPTAVVETTTTGETTSTTPDSTTTPCPDPHGGMCLGNLDAGSYTTVGFRPQIEYTVPGGWVNGEDLPGNFLLQKVDDERYLAIYQNVRVPAECDEAWAEGVGGTVGDLVAWYTSHPGLVTTEPEDVTVGGLSGVLLDISLEPTWDVTCPYSEGEPIVPLIIGDGTSQVHHVILPGFQERLYLLEWNGGNVTIEIGPEGPDLDEYLAEVMPIIESLRFGD